MSRWGWLIGMMLVFLWRENSNQAHDRVTLFSREVAGRRRQHDRQIGLGYPRLDGQSKTLGHRQDDHCHIDL